MADSRLVSVQDFVVHADHGQIYVQAYASAPPEDWDDDEVQLTALYEAWASARFVGVRPGFIDVLTPGQWNFQTPLRVEVWSAEPPDDRDGWDHEVDADLDVPDGVVSIVGPPSGERAVSATMAAGGYRVRISGRGFRQLGAAGANGDDSYRLRFWPRDQLQAPVLRKRWPGWDAYRLPDPSTYPSPYPEVVAEGDDVPDVVELPGAVAVVALDGAGRVLLLAPHPVGGALIELPACVLAGDEDPLIAAREELREQAGLDADTWHTLGDLMAFPGGLNESCRMFLARDLRAVPGPPPPVWVDLDEAVDRVFSNQIGNGVTAAAIVAATQARDTSWRSLQPPQ